MTRRICILLLALLLLLPSAALGEGGTFAGSGVADSYEAGMDLFALEDYALAAERFEQAGNYRDAKLWAYYCQAIHAAVTSGGDDAALRSAQVRFELLEAQSFADAAQWTRYCKARAYENSGMIYDAQTLFAGIAVHDSIDRYMACLNKGSVLENADSVRSRLAGRFTGTAEELYAAGMDLFYLEDYAAAADRFCLAGNFRNARVWRCYCMAISLVTAGENLEDAGILFELLISQGFEEARPWLVYCEARSYEQMGFYAQALELYKTIFVHDSSDRYMKLSGF